MHFSFGMLGQLLHSTALTNRNRQTCAKEGDIYVSVRQVGTHSTEEHSAQSSLLSSTPPQAACALLASVGGHPGLVSLLSD